MNYRLDAAPVVEQPLHYANSPGGEPYCGYENAWPAEKSSPPRNPRALEYAGLIQIGLYLEEVTCEECLHEAVKRLSLQFRDLGPLPELIGQDVADYGDLSSSMREAVNRLGELSLKRHHPDQYEALMMAKRRPEEPARLGAIVKDVRGVHYLRESVGSGQPWREFGAVRLGIEGEDDLRWSDMPNIVAVVFPGIEQ